MMRKTWVMLLIVLSIFILPINAFAKQKTFDISKAKSGFTKNEITVSNSAPVSLKIENRGKSNETQIVGTLKKKWTSYYLDQVFTSQTVIKPTVLPTKLSFTKGKAVESSSSIAVGMSNNYEYGAQAGIDKFLSVSASQQLQLSTTSTYTITNSSYWNVTRNDPINNYGRFQYAGYYVYHSYQYDAYKVKWNNKTKKFEKVGSNFKYNIHVPIGYDIVFEIKEYL